MLCGTWMCPCDPIAINIPQVNACPWCDRTLRDVRTTLEGVYTGYHVDEWGRVYAMEWFPSETKQGEPIGRLLTKFFIANVPSEKALRHAGVWPTAEEANVSQGQ